MHRYYNVMSVEKVDINANTCTTQEQIYTENYTFTSHKIIDRDMEMGQ